MKKICMKKVPYVKPEVVMIMSDSGALLAGSGTTYLPPDPTLDEGVILVGYIYEYGHEGDPNYIIDYILDWEDDDGAPANWGLDW